MIEIKNITKKFEEKIALNNVDFNISKGSVYGLVGSNGSGKSTLLRLISGVYTADSGSILIDGKEPFNNPAIKAGICYLADSPYFIHQANITEMARFYNSMYPSFSYQKFNELSNIFPLDLKAKINTMSKGMQRQAALMLSLATQPKYLLLDEAFDGLDPVMRKVLKNLLTMGSENGMTTIIASHNLRDLDYLCDSVGLLHFGKIVFNDEIENLKQKLHKVQLAFERVPDTSIFEQLDIVKTEKTGSLLNLVVRGNREEIMTFLKRLNPIFIEAIEPSFEEIFMYELEVRGYDAENIIK